LEIFARDGFDGASLPKIAEAAKVGHPLIHYHFGSKQHLWRETVTASIGGLVAEAGAVEIASRGLDPLEQLRVLIRAFTHFAARYPSHLAILMLEVRSRSERFDWLRDNFMEPFVSRWRKVLTEAQQLGLIKQIPLDNLISIIGGAITQYFSINPYLRPDVSAEELAEKHSELVIDVLLNGMAAKPGRTTRTARH
jgi:AcrR family transcriptional regulator